MPRGQGPAGAVIEHPPGEETSSTGSSCPTAQWGWGEGVPAGRRPGALVAVAWGAGRVPRPAAPDRGVHRSPPRWAGDPYLAGRPDRDGIVPRGRPDDRVASLRSRSITGRRGALPARGAGTARARWRRRTVRVQRGRRTLADRLTARRPRRRWTAGGRPGDTRVPPPATGRRPWRAGRHRTRRAARAFPATGRGRSARRRRGRVPREPLRGASAGPRDATVRTGSAPRRRHPPPGCDVIARHRLAPAGAGVIVPTTGTSSPWNGPCLAAFTTGPPALLQGAHPRSGRPAAAEPCGPATPAAPADRDSRQPAAAGRSSSTSPATPPRPKEGTTPSMAADGTD